MRDIARIQRNTIYYTNFESPKGNLTKLTIVLCAIGGVILGSLFFKFANFPFTIGTAVSKGNSEQSAVISKSASTKFDVFMETLFKAFGIDFYNPITILNSNYPYFKTFYNNNYLEYVAEQEKAELENKVIPATTDIAEITQIQDNNDKTVPEKEGEPLKEVSSSITFEGDVLESDKKDNPTISSGEIKIVNGTKYSIDIKKFLSEPIKLKEDIQGPKILVYHTHTTESFLKSSSELNKKNISSRTTDNRYNVVRVGESLISNLKKYDIDVLHNKTVHDKDYNSSYIESLKTLTNSIKEYPSFKMTIDLHRDAIPDQKLRVTKKIDGKDVAQIMFVIGTNSKYWKDNLRLAIKLQQRLNDICPGLAKPIYISTNRYNQHLTNGSIIVEIGGDGNIIDECVRSTSYLAQAINDVLYPSK